MSASPEKTVIIDGSHAQSVCDYNVGFLRFTNDGRSETAAPAGTGTFVKLGKFYGILTAGHVLEPMGKQEIVGLVRFPTVEPPLQNFRLNLNHTERIINWNGKDCDAPDIAILKIPEIEGRKLEAAGAVFYNLGIERNFAVSNPEHRMSKCRVVVGVVGEWTEDGPARFAKGRKITVGGLLGAVKTSREFKEGEAELIEVEIDHDKGSKIPKSYGGISGGGLWELDVELDKQLKPFKVNKRLLGIAFRQSGDRKRITSNASTSIASMKKTIEAKWPAEVN